MMIVYQEIKVSSTKHSKKTRCLVFSAQLSKHVPLRKQRKNFVFSGSITKWLPKYIAHVFLKKKKMKHSDKMPLGFVLKCFKRETTKLKQIQQDPVNHLILM